MARHVGDVKPGVRAEARLAVVDLGRPARQQRAGADHVGRVEEDGPAVGVALGQHEERRLLDHLGPGVVFEVVEALVEVGDRLVVDEGQRGTRAATVATSFWRIGMQRLRPQRHRRRSDGVDPGSPPVDGQPVVHDLLDRGVVVVGGARRHHRVEDHPERAVKQAAVARRPRPAGASSSLGPLRAFCELLRSFQAVTSSYQGWTQISSKLSQSSGST